MDIPALSDLKFGREKGRPMRVCVVSSEFLGPVRNGGIATATSGLLKQLVSDGHQATLLYTLVESGKPSSGDRPWRDWVDASAAEGITVEHIPHKGRYRDWREKSWHVKEVIGQREFDLVYFNEHHGSGYYTLLAKQAGLAPFNEQIHCVITHGAMEWVFDINDQFISGVADIEMMGLERRSAELADVVIGPSRYLLKQYQSYGWRLPKRTFHHPYPLFTRKAPKKTPQRVPVDEIVFFGRLEVRKGLWLFCEALDELGDAVSGKVVTFLGRTTTASGLSSGIQVAKRSAALHCRVKLLTDLNQEEALAYLREPGKLAVIPSLADNSPCVIYECLEAGIPFLTTRGSGTEELLDPKCLDDVAVRPKTDDLAKALKQALEQGAVLGRPRFAPNDNLAAWSSWHHHLSANRSEFFEKWVPAEETVSAPRTDAILVIVDDGQCTLSLLIDNLLSHAARFGTRAAYLVLTSRRGDLQEVVFDLINRAPRFPAGSLCIASPEGFKEAWKLVLSSKYAFFLEPEVQILTPFFAKACDLLAQKPGIASCISAVRQASGEAYEIEELPTGAVPGLSALGDPAGGKVIALDTHAVRDQLAEFEFFDRRADNFKSLAAFSRLMFAKCARDGIAAHFLPLVGAHETREPDRARPRAEFQSTIDHCAELDLPTSVYSGGAPWFALSAFGVHVEPAEPRVIDCVQSLPMDHPLRTQNANAHGQDPAVLAAALGRLDMSLQLAVAAGKSSDQVQHVTNLAMKSWQLRTPIDLAKAISEGGVTGIESRLRTASAGNGASERTYLDDKKLEIRRGRIRATTELSPSEPGKMIYIDVPLAGHTQIAAKCQPHGRNPLSLLLKVFDQGTGEIMGSAGTTATSMAGTEISIPLHGVYARATVVLEFSGPPGGELQLVSLAIQ